MFWLVWIGQKRWGARSCCLGGSFITCQTSQQGQKKASHPAHGYQLAGGSARLGMQLESRPPRNTEPGSSDLLFSGWMLSVQLEYKQARDQILWCLHLERTVNHKQAAQFTCAYESKILHSHGLFRFMLFLPLKLMYISTLSRNNFLIISGLKPESLMVWRNWQDSACEGIQVLFLNSVTKQSLAVSQTCDRTWEFWLTCS